MHLLITRPKTHSDTLRTELQKMGHSVLSAPLLEIILEKPHLDLSSLQAIIVTSRNAVQALAAHPLHHDILKLPLVVVGSGTASEARKYGFQICIEGTSGATELVKDIRTNLDPTGGALLHACGDVVAVDLTGALNPMGYAMRRTVVYHTKTADTLPQHVKGSLLDGGIDGVILMSPRTSNVWVNLISASELAHRVQSVLHICLSEAVAEPLASLRNIPIKICSKPNLKELLALINHLF